MATFNLLGAFSMPSLPQGLKDFGKNVGTQALNIAAADTASYTVRRAGNIITGKKKAAPVLQNAVNNAMQRPEVSNVYIPFPVAQKPQVQPESKMPLYLALGGAGLLAVLLISKK